MARMVSDPVWAQLDHSAGRLSRRTTRRLTAALVTCALLAMVASLVWRSGLVVARLGWNTYGGYSYEAGPGAPVRHSVEVTNDGWVPVTIVGLGRDLPGMRLVGVVGSFPVTLARGASASFAVRYEVVDCKAVSNEAWPVPVRVQRWWGEQTAYIEMPRPTPGAPQGFRFFEGRDPYEVEWQVNLASIACGGGR